VKTRRFLAAAAAAALLLSAAGASAQTDTLKKIKESGAITMGVRDASGAMSFTLGPGSYTGFHVEVCERVVADIGRALQIEKIHVKYQLVTPQNRIALVQNGTVDIECGTTTNNTARQKDVAFAPTLYVEGVRIAVKAASGIASPAQFSGKAVAATTGTTSVQLLRKLKREGAGEIAEVLAKDNSEGFLLLESGRVDGFAADGQILATLISKSREPAQYKLLDQVLSVEPIAIMLAKGDPAFKNARRPERGVAGQERRSRAALRQVVHAAHSSAQLEGRAAGQRLDEGRLGQSQRQADGSVRGAMNH